MTEAHTRLLEWATQLESHLHLYPNYLVNSLRQEGLLPGPRSETTLVAASDTYDLMKDCPGLEEYVTQKLLEGLDKKLEALDRWALGK